MLTWTMAHPLMTLLLAALMIVGLVFIVACICTTIEKVVKIKNRPSALESLIASTAENKRNKE